MKEIPASKYEDYRRRSISWLLRRGCSPEDAEEIYHDTLLWLFHETTVLPAPGAERPYLYAGLRSRLLAHFRKAAVRRERLESFRMEPAPDSSSAPDHHHAQVARACVRPVLARLTTRQVCHLWMAVVEEMTPHQIAIRTCTARVFAKERAEGALRAARKAAGELLREALA